MFKKSMLLILLLISSFAVSYLVTAINHNNMFDINKFGFQFVMFSIVGSFVYVIIKNFRFANTITALLLISTYGFGPAKYSHTLVTLHVDKLSLSVICK